MTFKKQFKTMKENWLLIVLFFVVIVVLIAAAGLFIGGVGSIGTSSYKSYGAPEMAMAERGIFPSADFAPEVEERVILKNAYLSTEVERGTFQDAEVRLKEITSSSDSLILNENVRKHGTDRKVYYSGTYRIKVPSDKYSSVVSQLKEIGEVESFSESADDVTGRA